MPGENVALDVDVAQAHEGLLHRHLTAKSAAGLSWDLESRELG